MTRIHSIPTSVLPEMLAAMLLAILMGTSAPAAEQSPWREIHSSHYTVITDAGEKKGIEVALRFEQMRAVFATLLSKDRLNEPVPLTIVAFKNDKDYYQSAPLHQGQPIDVPGFFLPGEDQNFIVLNLFEVESWRAVTHEYAHLLLNYNYPSVPGWFDEGLAEYFSSIRVDDKKYEIGGDPELHSGLTQDFPQKQGEVANPAKSLTELLSGEVWLALPDLLTMKHDTSSYAEETHHTLFYAQSWMVMHYLQHEKQLPQTGTYFDLTENQHVPVEVAIERAYGVSAEKFDQQVKEYFHSLTPLFTALDASGPSASKQSVSKQTGAQAQTNFPQVYQFPEIVGPDASVITAKVFPERDARAVAAEVKVRIPERREDGVKDLQALATTPEPVPAKLFSSKEKNQDDKKNAVLVTAIGNEIAHRVLAWDHIQRKEYDAAAEELTNAVSLNPNDIWIRYNSSVMKYRMAQAKHIDIIGLPNMIQDLRAVLEWYPEFANAYDLLATAHMKGGGPVAAMQAERAAIQLSPRNQQYVYNMAEIYIADKRWEAAVTLLDRLKASGNPQIAAAAKDRLTTIPNEQKYGISAAAAAAGQKGSAQPSPFDVLEQDAAKRAAADKAKSGSTADTRPAKFWQGRLVGVDCSQSPAAVLTVTSGGVVLKLRAADYKALLVIGADAFSCAWKDRGVSVNYKPGGMADGDLVSVEVR
jgi:tetratricopeptide (TPR) repeat protein